MVLYIKLHVLVKFKIKSVPNRMDKTLNNLGRGAALKTWVCDQQPNLELTTSDSVCTMGLMIRVVTV